MLALLGKLLGGGIVNSVEKVALEYIQTDKETAEAKSLLVQILDPNGKMRRDLSRFASRAYGFYLVTTTFLVFAHAYGIGDGASSKEAIDAMTGLFLPITGSWAAIVTASFGVNATNAIKRS